MRARGWSILPFCVLLLLGAAGFASSDFEQANKLYEEGRYTAAAESYEAIVSSGQVSAPLFFNLGNASFKNGRLGRAIYSYRRARALDPRDPDVATNLRFARERVNGSASVQEPAWARLISYFTLNELAWTAAVFFWLLLALLCARFYRPALRLALRPYLTLATALFALTALILALAWSRARTPTAIASSPQLTVHLGPLKQSQTAFTVPDGTELRIENRREGWLQVSDRSRRSGWVPDDSVLTLP
jgi:tetratricopeptide (TPR) repeat protein